MTEPSVIAPIALFVYSRPWHTQQTIEALQKNVLASESDLFIFSDAPKNPEVDATVQEVREYIKTVDGFKSVSIVERDENFGLANSIISGVTKLCNEFGRVIVVEDDLVTSPLFLKFMNDSLNYYKEKEKVWHISGWNLAADFSSKDDVYFWRVMDCWGWATWANRWKFFTKDTDDLLNTFTREDIFKFNLDGCDNLWSQVENNSKGVIDTWAIYWYATIFKKNGLCLNPIKSYVRNIGLDGSGENCGHGNDNLILNIKDDIRYENDYIENEDILEKIKLSYSRNKKNIILRIINKVSRAVRRSFSP